MRRLAAIGRAPEQLLTAAESIAILPQLPAFGKRAPGHPRLASSDATLHVEAAKCQETGAARGTKPPTMRVPTLLKLSSSGSALLDWAMPQVTYFAVLPFSRTEDGDFLAEAAIEVRSAEQARSTAQLMAAGERGAVAFSKTGDPRLGKWGEAVVLGRYGDVPDDPVPYIAD